MRLLVDAQPPPALARWLTAQGHDAQHVFDESFRRWLTDAVFAMTYF